MLLVALCCAAASAWLWRPRSRGGTGRLVPGRPAVPRSSPGGSFVEAPVPRTCLCVAAASFLGWFTMGTIGAAAGVAAGVGLSVWVGRLEPAAVTRAREEIRRDLPLAVDLLAACSSVGRSVQESLPAVSHAVGGALGARLDEIVTRLSLGADPAAEWARLALDPGWLSSVVPWSVPRSPVRRWRTA